MPRVIAEVLDEYAPLVRAAVRSFLPALEPRRYLYDLVADYPTRGGKLLRPCLCIATARALGAPLDAALVQAAASIELMHNAMLVHDDIQDDSLQRRGKPTLHTLWGVPMAINAGDALAVLSLRPLLALPGRRSDPQLVVRLLEEAERTARESAEGQALELGWRYDNVDTLHESDYLHMVLKKTCWLTTIYPLRVGALMADAGRVDAASFVRFGFFMGAAFQIRDDELNLVADEVAYGKETCGDLREGKRTLMVIHLLGAASPAERARIRAHLARPLAERSDEDVRFLRERMDHHGSLHHAQLVARAMAGAALAEHDHAFRRAPPSRDRDFVRALVHWMVDRDT